MPPKSKKQKQNKNKQKKKDKLPQPNAQRRTVMQERGPRLSACAAKYALSIVAPFHPSAFGACNPAGRETFTQKAHCTQRFLATVGSSGVGWVLVSPSLANDCVNAFYTMSTYSGVRANALSANNNLTNGVTTSSPTTLPYNSLNLADSTDYDSEVVTGRIVAMGLTATYVGTTLNESGMVYALHDPSHMSVSGATQDDIGTYQQAVISPVTKRPVCISCFSLCDSEDQCAYQSPVILSNGTPLVYPYNDFYSFNTTYKGPTAYSYDTGTGAGAMPVGAPVMVIIFTGVSGSQFQIEMITHVEYAGQTPQSMLTRAHSDVQGAASVKIAATASTIVDGPTPYTWADRWSGFTRELGRVSRDFAAGFLAPELNRLRIHDI